MTARSPFEAISDPTRRAILDSLADQGPTRAGDLAQRFPEISRPAVSKHLRVLRSASLVRQENRGREIWYSIEPLPLQEVYNWMKQYEEFWADKLAALKRAAENPD